MKYMYYSTVLLVALTITSCQKILTVKLPNNQIGKKEAFADVQTANAALAGLYAGLRENSPISASSGAILSTYTDELECFASTDLNGLYPIFDNQQIDANSVISSFWSSSYQRIYEANLIIEGADQSNLSIIDKKRIKGEALLVRSLLLFYLQQLFGDTPYVTTTDYIVNQSLSKTSSVEILKSITNDLNECVELLSDDYRNSERVFPNKKVAQLLLAKIYLLQQKWNDAELTLKTIVQSPQYQFQDDLNKVFDKSSNHILWQLKPQNSTDPTKESLLYYFANSAPSLYAISNDLLNNFSATDLRKQLWSAPVSFNGRTWYRANKYKNITSNSTEYSIVFRLEEVYLLLAESLVQQDKITEALPFINKIKQRATINQLAMPVSKESALIEISVENRREFFTEMGHRFLDLKRQNMLSMLKSSKSNWRDFHIFWPLPQKELLINVNLKPQNIGY